MTTNLRQTFKQGWATGNKSSTEASALSHTRDFTYRHCHRGTRMRDAPRRRREGWHAAVDAAVEGGVEAAAVVADMEQLGEMTRWRGWGGTLYYRDLIEVAVGEVLKCSLSRKERGHVLYTGLQTRANSNLFLSLFLSFSLCPTWIYSLPHWQYLYQSDSAARTVNLLLSCKELATSYRDVLWKVDEWRALGG